jgi:hypothetical protein
MNWVVNLHGQPGMFIEMDLMQEHFNFWLEDMAQHKGKGFEEPFYRWVLSVNVHHFLHLKDEMENIVFLKARTKKHSAPHLNNELKAIMSHLRDAEVNCRSIRAAPAALRTKTERKPVAGLERVLDKGGLKRLYRSISNNPSDGINTTSTEIQSKALNMKNRNEIPELCSESSSTRR